MEKYLVEEKVKVAIAVNGKLREVMEIESELALDQSKVILRAKESEVIKRWLTGKKIVKEIYIKGKMLNFVVAESN